MYHDDQPRIAAMARASDDGFARVCTFVLLTIKTPLYQAASDYPIVRRGDTSVRSVFGAKHAGLAYVKANAAALREDCEEHFELADDAADLIVERLTAIPGIGLAKAGFICQMVYGLSGCIDTHNLKRFELPENAFRLYKNRPHRNRRVKAYNAFCRRAGGTAALWDGWCEYVSANQPTNYPTPDYVSKMHLVTLKG